MHLPFVLELKYNEGCRNHCVPDHCVRIRSSTRNLYTSVVHTTPLAHTKLSRATGFLFTLE
jgi:hypothetical protein